MEINYYALGGVRMNIFKKSIKLIPTHASICASPM